MHSDNVCVCVRVCVCVMEDTGGSHFIRIYAESEFPLHSKSLVCVYKLISCPGNANLPASSKKNKKPIKTFELYKRETSASKDLQHASAARTWPHLKTSTTLKLWTLFFIFPFCMLLKHQFRKQSMMLQSLISAGCALSVSLAIKTPLMKDSKKWKRTRQKCNFLVLLLRDQQSTITSAPPSMIAEDPNDSWTAEDWPSSDFRCWIHHLNEHLHLNFLPL